MTVKEGARDRILAAAERLFAERGPAAVSLREIGAAAGQRNNSAVQYHFGDRDALVRALFTERLGPLDARRRALLAALAPGERADLRALVRVYLLPLAELVSDAAAPTWYARFVQRFAEEDLPPRPPLDPSLAGAIRETTALIERAMPAALGPGARAERLRLMRLLTTSAIADAERRLDRGEPLPLPYDALVDSLIDAAVAVLGGP